jgi:adenine/guanine phosphoribosyltransferase-like PRPP-binding protein
LIDDVISSGISMAAGIELLARCTCAPIALAAAMLQSERWREPLANFPADHIVATFRTPLLKRDAGGRWA